MKQLLFIVFFIIPYSGYAQLININVAVEPNEMDMNLGIGGWYSSDDSGFWIDITSNFKSKMSVAEKGVSANIAASLRETDFVESYISLKGGPLIRLYKSIWLNVGVAVNLLDDFSEHSDKYWIFRERKTKVSPVGGLSLNKIKYMSISIKYQPTPEAITVSLGYTFSR